MTQAKVKLRALRPISGNYGVVDPGGVFEIDEAGAESLEARGLAERYRGRIEPKMQPAHENKMLKIPENKRRT